MIATSRFLTAPECIKFVFGLGSAPYTAKGAYSAPLDSLAGLKGALLLTGGDGIERKRVGDGTERER